MEKRILIMCLMVGTTLGGPALQSRSQNGMWPYGQLDFGSILDPINMRMNDLHSRMNTQMDSLSNNLNKQWDQVSTDLNSQWDQMSTDLNNQWDQVSKDVNNHWNAMDFGGMVTNMSDSINKGVGTCCNFDFVDHFSTPFYGMDVGSIFRREKPWWAGDNVCKNEVVEDGDQLPDNIMVNSNTMLRMQVKNCKESLEVRECSDTIYDNGKATTVTVTYSCCPGYKLKSVGGKMPTCQEHELKPMEETLASLEGTDFLALISEENLLAELTNSTVFMPTNEALDNFRAELNQFEPTLPEEQDAIVYAIDDGLLTRRRRALTVVETADMKELLLGHLSSNIVETKDLKDGQMIASKGRDSGIRISVYETYPEATVMANCAKITSKNHHTTEGIVHVLDRVLMPATATVGELLSSDLQFRDFTSILGGDLLADLKSKDKSFTVFVPTEEALQSLEPEVRETLFNEGSCGPQIVKSHILPSVICTGIVDDKAKTETISGDQLHMRRDEDGNVYVEDAKLVMRDLVATNGVIHVIDKVIIPESAKTLKDVLKQTRAHSFLDLVSPALLRKLSSQVKDGMTMFIPSEDSLAKIPAAIMDQLKKDENQLEKILLHHMVPAKENVPAIHQDRLTSLAGTSLHKSNQMYRTYLGGVRNHVTVGCARVAEDTHKMCGGYLHTIDRILTPPKGGILDAMKSSGKHQNFLKLMDFAGLSQLTEDPHTVFAPVDAAFTKISDSLKDILFTNRSMAEAVVRNHIAPEIICCTPGSYNMGYRTIRLPSGSQLHIRYTMGTFSPALTVNGAHVERCNSAVENGVVHHIDSLLLPHHLQQQQDSGIYRQMWIF